VSASAPERFCYRLRVRFAETDQMGIAHHASYVVWLEAARIAWLRSIGLSYKHLEESGVSLAVSGLDLAYRAPCRFDDRIGITVVPTTLRSRRVAFDYGLILLDDGTTIATAATVHTPTGDRGRAVRLPSDWLAALRHAVR
jgi:acyl-CoA thioester hydrolase